MPDISGILPRCTTRGTPHVYQGGMSIDPACEQNARFPSARHSPRTLAFPSATVFARALRLWLWVAILCSPILALTVSAQVPAILTDKIRSGSGSINLLKDISALNLQQYLTSNGKLLLGVDVNEANSGNESSTSQGVAIKQMQLLLTTTAGTFSFSDFYTKSTAMIRESEATSAQEFYTLFGKGGSSSLNGGTAGFNLGQLDDVVEVHNVSLQGTLLSARLDVTFLNTAASSVQGNETFFDFSGGFEEFAILGPQDAAILASANFGVADAPSGVTYAAKSSPGTTSAPAAPGAPVPPFTVLAMMGALVAWRARARA